MKNKTFLPAILLLLCYAPAFGQEGPEWQWAKSGQGTGHDYGNSISTDANGNCYATGYFQVPSIIFGDDTLSGSTSYHDYLYVVKYDNAGNQVWAKTATGGPNNSHGSSIRTDANGNSYVAGYFDGTGTITLGSITLTATDGDDGAFVAKYDPNGNVLWAKTPGELASGPGAFYIDIDDTGNSYVTGTFDDSTIAVKYDNSGNLIWRKYATGAFRSPNICTSPNGDSYVTGCFKAGTSITFGSTTVTNTSSGWIIFVVKYDHSGNVVWAKSDGSYPSLYDPSISTDGNGNCFVTGYFNGNYAKFGNTVLTNAGYNDIFIVKYNSSGDVAWAKRAGGAAFDEGRCIKTDPDGNSYLTGMFSNLASFGSTDIFTKSNAVFVAKYDSSGNALWAQQTEGTGGSNISAGNGIGIDANGYSYVTGYFSSNYSYFGNTILTNCDTITSPSEVFVAKLTNISTGIEEQNNLLYHLTVSPNPFSQQTTLQTDNHLKNASLVVYNSVGLTVKHIENLPGQTIVFHRDNLPSGLYFVRLMQDNKTLSVHKLVIVDE